MNIIVTTILYGYYESITFLPFAESFLFLNKKHNNYDFKLSTKIAYISHYHK